MATIPTMPTINCNHRSLDAFVALTVDVVGIVMAFFSALLALVRVLGLGATRVAPTLPVEESSGERTTLRLMGLRTPEGRETALCGSRQSRRWSPPRGQCPRPSRQDGQRQVLLRLDSPAMLRPRLRHRC